MKPISSTRLFEPENTTKASTKKGMLVSRSYACVLSK